MYWYFEGFSQPATVAHVFLSLSYGVHYCSKHFSGPVLLNIAHNHDAILRKESREEKSC